MSSRLLKKLLKEKNRDEIKKKTDATNGEDEKVTFKQKKKKNFFKYLDLAEERDDSSSDSDHGKENTDKSVDKENTDKSVDKENTDKSVDKENTDNKSVECTGKNENIGENGKMSKKYRNVEQNRGKEDLPPDVTSKGKMTEKAEMKKKKKKKKKKINVEKEISNILGRVNKVERLNNASIVEEKENAKQNMQRSENEKEKEEKLISQIRLCACTHEKYDYCLKLEKNKFDVNIELKRIFGNNYIKNKKKYKKKSKIYNFKKWLIQDNNENQIKEIPLKMLYSNNEFKIEKLKLYIQADNLYYLYLDSHNIQNMNNLLKKYPFHIDTLLILSEYYNEINNYEISYKYIKLSLILLQNIFHFNFNPFFFNNNFFIFMNPFLYNNKCLFKCLYIHMVFLENEACIITSLEIAKLLCKLDLNFDLCSILLRIDNMILKCNLYDFLIYFSFNFILQNLESIISSDMVNYIVKRFPSGISSFNVGEISFHSQDCNTFQSSKFLDTNREREKTDEVSATDEADDIGQDKNQCNRTKEPSYLHQNDDFYQFETRLHFILPNFAFSIPLCLYLKNNTFVEFDIIEQITVKDITDCFLYEECKFLSPHFNIIFNCYKNATDNSNGCNQKEDNNMAHKSYSLSFSAHLLLLRALLCYPSFLQIFLNYNNFNTTKVVKQTIYDTSFSDILSHPPFSNNTLFTSEEHDTVQKIIACYLEKGNMYYKSEKIITWFHVCSAFIHRLYKDASASEQLERARIAWHQRKPLLDIKKYKDVRVGEFKSNNFLLPDFMMEKNRTYSATVPDISSNYYVSLNSNLIIAFFQSLLPWYQVDYYGTHSRPVYFSTILRTVINKTKRLFNL
ncbi:transcription factor 25, putative [Plasmodium ovale]|uniref:Transcription factor 25, putative n=1 Tax=Plasmodium ovale TaxID=36330 RepID=A0A1D3U916_PLAOA|nr:transcription factor 25, putative [Plasmodium ovale]